MHKRICVAVGAALVLGVVLVSWAFSAGDAPADPGRLAYAEVRLLKREIEQLKRRVALLESENATLEADVASLKKRVDSQHQPTDRPGPRVPAAGAPPSPATLPSTQAELLQAFKAAHAAKDMEALAKLIYWEGTPDFIKGMWKSQYEVQRFGQPIKKAEVKGPDPAHGAGGFNLAVAASLVVTYDVSRSTGGATVAGTQTVTYPVGVKDRVFYILMPKLGG